MKRASFTLPLLAALMFGGLAAAAEKPNFVLIFADDLGVNDLSCYGRADQPTPNLDRMAREGMRFTCGYCSQPICSPSRAVMDFQPLYYRSNTDAERRGIIFSASVKIRVSSVAFCLGCGWAVACLIGENLSRCNSGSRPHHS
jgi:hypothetical protein